MVAQGLGHRPVTAEDAGSTPGQGTKIPQATPGSQKNKKLKKPHEPLQELFLGSYLWPQELRWGSR